MSGIAGHWARSGSSVRPDELRGMLTMLNHRGPDAADIWCDASVALGHCLLHTTPESLRESQPLERDGLVISADARIDNRDELVMALAMRHGVPDSELILAAYARWGERAPERLVGDFAFAIWDPRRHQLFCARDHLGGKPFHYYLSNDVFVFASEIKALFSVGVVPRRVDEERIAHMFLALLEDRTGTSYEGILRLPAAHSLTVRADAYEVKRYWEIDRETELGFRSDAEYDEAFRATFTEAVRSRVRSMYPVGALLSGGLDSSAVVAVARGLLPEDGERSLQTFSYVFDDFPQCDERRYIRDLVAQDGLASHFISGDAYYPFPDWERVFWHLDGGFFGNVSWIWELSKAAASHGVRVLLDGMDGDTVLSYGLPYLTELARRGRFRALRREMNRLHETTGVSRKLLFRAFVVRPLAPRPVIGAWRTLRRRGDPDSALATLVNRDFARRIDLDGRLAQYATRAGWDSPAKTEREEHVKRLSSGLIEYSLEHGDKVAATFSLELRHPFFDKRLVEFCLALPAEHKLGNGFERLIMRRSLNDVLPPSIAWRPHKTTFAPVVERGLKVNARDLLDDVILHEPGRLAEYLDMDAVSSLYRAYCDDDQTVFPAGVDPTTVVWAVAQLGLWLRTLDRTPVRAQRGAIG